ncbi:MAG: hydroxymethylbilane synthase [Gammaproteobacteria bacterium]|nr:hydroxymethylbilane synthase [Gammaproteobacteria bacterium]
MTKSVLKIATRESPLAMWQARYVADQLQRAHPGLTVELLGMSTEGDRFLAARLASMGGKGLFVKELEQALLTGAADLAVHSMKDVPVALPEGLEIAVIMAREDPRDAYIANEGVPSLMELPAGSRIGTASMRRRMQLQSLRPDLEYLDLRGNVGTRLRKLREGEFHAIILAAAGLKRLGMAHEITAIFEHDELIPAIGQGALGLECRSDDAITQSLIAPLNDRSTQVCVMAERALNESLDGGCHLPVAGHARWQGGEIVLSALVAGMSPLRVVRGSITATADNAIKAGAELGGQLLRNGGAEILETLKAEGV